ncbi:MAG: NFACT family protein [Microcoleaceae cyanobacterium]
MQSVDFTTLMAICSELRSLWLPARLEQVYQRDRFTISLHLRTLKQKGWLDISWHPQAARLCIGDPPPRRPDTFTFSDQLRHQLNGLALVAIETVSPWERVLDLQFAKRPGEVALWHLYVEVMNKYSNVVLTGDDNLIVTVAHQVSQKQSSVRPLQTGQPYEFPPSLTDPIPCREEPEAIWQERVSLIPGSLRKQLIKSYRGLSSSLAIAMIRSAGLDPEQSNQDLTENNWASLFRAWQTWLDALEHSEFQPNWTETGYTVIDWQSSDQAPPDRTCFNKINGSALNFIYPEVQPKTVQQLLNIYYNSHLNQQDYTQLRHQILQKLDSLLKKLRIKKEDFTKRLAQSDDAETYRNRADLLMANLHEWQPGMTAIDLADFETGETVTLTLNPEKNAVQNAQAYYKRHQKLKRSRNAIEPLLQDVQSELSYLESIEDAILQLESCQSLEDLQILEEIQEELVRQGYLNLPNHQSKSDTKPRFYIYRTPSGFDLWVGRNNRQNDQLTFDVAGTYDLWFHTQEIPGSHVLLRLDAGVIPDDKDLQFAANVAAFYSKARQSDQAPVIYTKPKHIYKPKGAKPGMVIYKHETVIWGYPQKVDASTLVLANCKDEPTAHQSRPPGKQEQKHKQNQKSNHKRTQRSAVKV